MTLKCAKAPCRSCPYRRDVPSGVWAKAEYDKLPGYDGEIIQQMMKGATGVFMCHQNDGKLCAGWVGTHGPHNLAALRLHRSLIDDSVGDYKSPVPLFASGAEASAHGRKQITRPNVKAQTIIKRLLRKRMAK